MVRLLRSLPIFPFSPTGDKGADRCLSLSLSCGYPAKNVALAGVKSVTIYDPTPITIQDLSSQFFLRVSDVGTGKSRADATAPRLAELNSYVPVRVLDAPMLDASALSSFQVRHTPRSSLSHGPGPRWVSCANF